MSVLPRVILKPREEDRILAGHPWIFDNEIGRIEGQCDPGAIVDVESSRKRYLGRGYINHQSKIRVRLLSHSKEGIDTGFWKRRLRQALEYRAGFLNTATDSFRLVFAEADLCPGLIIDLYRDISQGPQPRSYATVQFLSLGVALRANDILTALRETINLDGVVERGDAPVRLLEGLSDASSKADPGVPEEIRYLENGLSYSASLLSGQKTGAFLDQRENHLALRAIAGGRRVLDAFSNTGGFGLNALAAGALRVDFLDSSVEALAKAGDNAERNGFAGNYSKIGGNAFDFLSGLHRGHSDYSLIVLDPPAFAKNRDAMPAAYRGYKEINYRAMSCLPENGWLVTCSCSQHFSEDLFLSMLRDAAQDAGRRLRIAELRHQSKDHPILSGYPESLYLKCVMAQVI